MARRDESLYLSRDDRFPSIALHPPGIDRESFEHHREENFPAVRQYAVRGDLVSRCGPFWAGESVSEIVPATPHGGLLEVHFDRLILFRPDWKMHRVDSKQDSNTTLRLILSTLPETPDVASRLEQIAPLLTPFKFLSNWVLSDHYLGEALKGGHALSH